MGKKIISILVNTLCVVAILFSLISGWTVLSTPRGKAPTVMGHSIMTVLTGSMEPALPEGSLVVVRKTPAEEIAVGDIITFYAHIGGHDGVINTHRVIEVGTQDGAPAFQTQGDANDLADPVPVLAAQLVGRVVWCSQIMGKIVNLVRSPFVFLPLVLIPLLLILITYARRLMGMAREEVAQAQRELEEEAKHERENDDPKSQ